MATHSPKKYFDERGNLIIKPYRLKDLAVIFDINQLTLKRWMGRYADELGEKVGKYYSIRQVEFIVEKFGLPRKIMLAA